MVSINDDRFKNKVVVVQMMGSWCPNCMDETAFLSDYYNRNRYRVVEVVSLAYEYSTDRARSVKTLKKFQQRFNVQYPMLITGVTVNDSLRTEKTLPELTPINSFLLLPYWIKKAGCVNWIPALAVPLPVSITCSTKRIPGNDRPPAGGAITAFIKTAAG